MSSRLPKFNKTDPRPKRIGVFRGDWGFLSNFSPVEVKLWIGPDGLPVSFPIPDGPTTQALVEIYPSVEHAYQAAKFLDPEIRARFRYVGLEPGQAKSYAKNLEEKGLVRLDWKQVQLEIMRGLLVQKFSYSILRRKLLSTFGAELVEGNWWHDNFFGDCLCDECAGIPGENHLGRMLMELRAAAIRPPSSPPSFPSSTF